LEPFESRRIALHGLRSSSGWRPANDSESVCVWDLEVLWRERQAYVATVLRPGGSDIEAYLATDAVHGGRGA